MVLNNYLNRLDYAVLLLLLKVGGCLSCNSLICSDKPAFARFNQPIFQQEPDRKGAEPTFWRHGEDRPLFTVDELLYFPDHVPSARVSGPHFDYFEPAFHRFCVDLHAYCFEDAEKLFEDQH